MAKWLTNAELTNGWIINADVDDDNHLNIYITNELSDRIYEIDTGQGNGIYEQLALRFTTKKIEDDYDEKVRIWCEHHK